MVLPTRDRPNDLLRALQSVLAQTHRALEVLVVDDASTTGVEDLVERATGGDGRVELVRLPAQRGAAGARNAGLARASGEMVAFLDDDDFWEPHKIAAQLDFMDRYPEVGVVSCDYLVIDDNGTAPIRFRGPGAYSAAQVQWMNLPGSFSFVMARRSLVGEELQLDESFPSVEDWDLWLRCVRRAPAGVVREPLVRHKVHGGLSKPRSEQRGLEVFITKHEDSLPEACLRFLQAHLRMLAGEGWGHRRAVARSLVSGSPRVTTLLVIEQLARQIGVLRRDPGIVARTITRLLGPDGRVLGIGAR